MTNVNDRAVQALIADAWLGEWVDGHDLSSAVATVLRVVRDDIVMAWQAGEISDLLGAERLLNERIEALTGKPTMTGDTTEAEPEPIVALVTVDENGHLTPESAVTVGEWTWPVPEKAEHGGVLWWPRVGQVLQEHGYRPVPDYEPMASTLGPNYSEVRVEPIEAKEEG